MPILSIDSLPMWYQESDDLRQVWKVAIPHEAWHSQYCLDGPPFFMDWRSSAHVEEITLVVGDISASEVLDVVFVEPQASPFEMLNKEVFCNSNMYQKFQESTTWAEVEESAIDIFKLYQDDRAQERKNYSSIRSHCAFLL